MRTMKKKVMIMTLACAMAAGAKAQVYSYDRRMEMPTRDLYDNDMMNMLLRATAETAQRRKESFRQYSQMATEAYNAKRWSHAINYVNLAFGTQYENGTLYYIRGYAYEQLGDYKSAKKDYKKGVKFYSVEAAQALERLKEERKRQ